MDRHRRGIPTRLLRHRRARGSRGQTTIDFLVAMGVFLTVAGFLFMFVPRLLAPFDGGGELPLVANRLADQLVGYHLADQGRYATLNVTCVGYFFNGTTPDPCPAFDASRPLNERLGVSTGYRVNVTVERDADGDSTPEVLCSDGSGVVACGGGGGGNRLAAGPDAPAGHDSVVVARRTAYLDGRDVQVVVRAW